MGAMMAPATAHGTDDMVDGLTWVYWKFYPLAPNEADLAITYFLRFMHREVQPVVQWHFVRIVDPDGFHIRFRFLTHRDSADSAVEAFIRLAEVLPDLSAGEWKPIRPHAEELLARRRRRELQWRTYAPETNKWGTGENLRLAHRTFSTSSRFAVEALDSIGDARDRTLVAMTLLTSVRESLPLKRDDSIGFLRQHQSWWDPRGSLAQLGESDSATMRRVTRRRDEMPSEIGPAIAAARLHGAEIVDASLRSGGERNPLYFAHQHVHLAINRLGIHGTDEAWVSHLAQMICDQSID
jgi:thiopeptide-type bacteriocin biosynthesis protein